MFLIRQAKPDDLDTLLKLAKMVHFINLPADRGVIENKIRWSAQSFARVRSGAPVGRAEDEPDLPALGGAAGSSPLFMFIVEDLDTGNTVGTSSLVQRMGGPGQPNVTMELTKKEFFSEDLQAGATHVTAKVVLDESGPSEIGGLIVGPSFRRHPLKVGKQLSLVRFHYLGLHRERFQDRVLAEMMAPLTPDGRNTFWEYFGRRFINLTYDEADRFCQKSREFMISLLPREEIYLTLLPPEARAIVGKVGRDTVPARRMLEAMGFEFRGRIDPFDAGPHLMADTDRIPLVGATRRATLGEPIEPGAGSGVGFISVDRDAPPAGGFRCVWAEYALDADAVRTTAQALSALRAAPGDEVGLTPVEGSRAGRSKASAAAGAGS